MAAADKQSVRPRDQAARDRIIRSTGTSLLVEAAAGTGKTTLIVDRILQGLRDGTLRLGTTVAITFTEKAAGELESRVRSRLAQALREPDAPSQERARLEQAAAELDRANISTIHAFCARLLREKPIEAGVDPEFEVLEPAAADVLYEDCWQRWMDVQVAQPPQALAEALRAGVSVGDLEALAGVLAAAPEIVQGPEFRMPRPSASARELMGEFTASAQEVARIFREHMKGRGNDASRELRSLAGAAAAADPDSAAARRLAYRAAALDPEQAVTSIANDARDTARAAFERFVGSARGVGAHLAADVFEWGGGFVTYWQAAKLARSVLDFQDLLLFTTRMLQQDLAVRRYFQQRFGAFFVDEFQDTDPLQAELIAYLCEDRPGPPAGRMEDVRLADGKLVAVGDPKQSIYRFRRADVQVYDRFKELFGPGRTELIYCNFRSAARLIEWFNALFERIFGEARGPGVYQARHVALVAPATASAEAGPHVLAVCPPPGLCDPKLKAEGGRRREALFLARTVRELVEGGLPLPGRRGGWRYADFTFLFRALTDADTYEDALDEHGVPYVVVGGKHFYRREQTVETVALLRAVDDPLDEAAIVGALRGSYFGLSDEELLAHRQAGGGWDYAHPARAAGPTAQALARLAEWHEARSSMPPHLLLERILAQTRAREAFMLKPAGAQRAANLDKLVGQVRALGATARTFGAVVRHLSRLQAEEPAEEESSAMEPGDDFVRIMSMHKAKGLEFGAVVLPDLLREFRKEHEVGPLLFNRLERSVALRVARGIESENYGALRAAEHGNQMAELRRLLYVACTRAERLLVLPMGWWPARSGCESFQSVLEATGLLAAGGDVPFGLERDGVFYPDTRPWLASTDLGRKPTRLQGEPEAEVQALVQERARWSEEHGRLAARASAAERFILPSGLEPAFSCSPLAEEAAGRPGGKDFGSLFHSLMSVVPLGGAEPAAPDLLRGLAAIQAAELGAGAEAGAEAAGLAADALRHVKFTALLAGAQAVEREVGFCVRLDSLPVKAEGASGFVEGSMDLLVRSERGCLILDYKTDRFRPGEEGRVAERYWPQLGLYALAAQAGGLVGEWVELALFFVRAGCIVRRPMDAALVRLVAELVARNLAGPGP